MENAGSESAEDIEAWRMKTGRCKIVAQLQKKKKKKKKEEKKASTKLNE